MRYGDEQAEHLIVTDLSEDVVIFSVEDDALVEVSRFFQPGAQAMTGLDADGSGVEHMLMHVWWSNGNPSRNDVMVVIAPEVRAW